MRALVFVKEYIMFLCTYVACLITPVVFGIEQSVSYSDSLTGFLALCDLCFAFDFFVWWLQNRSYLKAKKLQKMPKHILYDGLVRFVGCSCLYLIPFAAACGMSGSDQAWLTLLRMVRFHCHQVAIFLVICVDCF
jgi:hypothetical protein